MKSNGIILDTTVNTQLYNLFGINIYKNYRFNRL